MAKIKWEFETLYDTGDTVILDYNGVIRVGKVRSFYVDGNAGNSIWYIIALYFGEDSESDAYADVAEFSIIGKIKDKSLIDKLDKKDYNN